MPRPIWATSNECVSRVRGVSLWRGPTTWVLSASRRRAAQCSTRARSLAKSVRCSEPVPGSAAPFGGSTTSRCRSNSSYGSGFPSECVATEAQSARSVRPYRVARPCRRTTLTIMRIARLFSLVLAIVTAGFLLAPAARATPPMRLPGYVTDDAGVLTGSQKDSVEQAIDKLYNDRRIRLWVVYVDSFDGRSAVSWTESTRQTSDLSDQDAILAVATADRSYAFLAGPATGLSSSDVDSVRRDKIEPALRNSELGGRRNRCGRGPQHGDHPGSGDFRVRPARCAGHPRRLGAGVVAVDEAAAAQATRGRVRRGAPGGSLRPERAGVGATRRARRPVQVDGGGRRQRRAHQRQRTGPGRRGIRRQGDCAVQPGGGQREDGAGAGVQRPPDPR